jgi:hypothetical protein
MRGWKTWVAGIGLIGVGTYGFIASWMDGYSALQWILNGLGFIGVGHKIDKGSNT